MTNAAALLTVALLDLCRDKGIRIATAESCTGGQVAVALTDIAGSSDVFERGYVTYTNTAKTEMLGVRGATLAAVGAVSTAVAREMALGALANSDATLTVSVTGIAGPGGSDHKPEGRVCFATAFKGTCHAETVEFGALGREEVRREARNHALGLLHTAASAM